MSAVPIRTKSGPRTYTPADDSVFKGGLGVAATTGSRVVVSGANSTKFLGVALNDAVAPEDFPPADGTDSLGRPTVSMVPIPTSVAVAYGGMEVEVTYAADTAFGERLVCAANGTFTPFTGFSATAGDANVDFSRIVGICTEPAGVDVSEKATGLMRIL